MKHICPVCKDVVYDTYLQPQTKCNRIWVTEEIFHKNGAIAAVDTTLYHFDCFALLAGREYLPRNQADFRSYGS